MIKTWNEWTDIFGFEKSVKLAEKEKNEDPIQDISVSAIVSRLNQYSLNGKAAKRDWENEIQWGQESDVIRLTFSPLGSFKAIIRKKSHDLLGKSIWVCKEIVPLLYVKHEAEEELAEKLMDKLNQIDVLPPDSPSEKFTGLEKLSSKLSVYVRKHAPNIFVFEGVRKKNDNNFLIYMSLRGQGVEAPGSARVEEFIIDLSYSQTQGTIRCFGHDVQSPIKGHIWEPQPSEWDEIYCPSQPVEEIINTTIAALSTY